MSSLPLSHWQSPQAQDYEAAESMLQHSRRARTTSQVFSNDHSNYSPSYTSESGDMQRLATSNESLPLYSDPGPRPLPSLGSNPSDHLVPIKSTHIQYPASNSVNLPPLNIPHESQRPYASGTTDPRGMDTASNSQQRPLVSANTMQQRASHQLHVKEDQSHGSWSQTPSGGSAAGAFIKAESKAKPSWAFEKTKAGKDRKRLPLACIACRRKKIRCSGEKPTCKHCARSRVPCVYKVATRKAAPRTDYMVMLDRRLKRMEERVMKCNRKGDMSGPSTAPKSSVRPAHGAYGHASKKRGAEEAFGAEVDKWAKSNPHPHGYKSFDRDQTTLFKDGAEHLPSKEMQEHLSEVFFDYVYGQSYHLMHKPTYMRKLREQDLPPVIVLAVCAVAARFSNHPDLSSQPLPRYLRGEEWAAPVREIILKRYDEPNIYILTVSLILGLHEFGTCQGGRSWMFSGMAMRIAHALQLHREVDHDPMAKKGDKAYDLSSTDREIRRRAMWSCFTMDRFVSSGTGRPMYADECDIKIQLPIDEAKFQQEISGPTEGMFGKVYHAGTMEPNDLSDAKANTGVAAYMVRAIALWGRVIKYLNLGGQEEDAYPQWDSRSRFHQLQRQATDLIDSLPAKLIYTSENLTIHDAAKIANQFIFLHVALHQTVLFLHRFAVPTRRSPTRPEGMPEDFFLESLRKTTEAANKVALLLSNALKYRVVAPFMGYCAFTSCTVLSWVYFFGAISKRAAAIQDLSQILSYLRTMKEYWGVLHFMARELRETYKHHGEAAQDDAHQNSSTTGNSGSSSGLLQFGDWFDKFPHGVAGPPKAGEERNPIKQEPVEDNPQVQQPLRAIEQFFDDLDPPAKDAPRAERPRKPPRLASRVQDDVSQPQSSNSHPDNLQATSTDPIPASATIQEVPQSPFTPATQSFQDPYSVPLTFSQFTTPNPSLIPQLDRQLVYDAYAGNDPTGSMSASHLNVLKNMNASHGFGQVDGSDGLWDASSSLDLARQQMLMSTGSEYVGDPTYSTAWFMPFNLQQTGNGYGGLDA